MNSVIEVVADLLKQSVETTFIPGRIDHCPECDSDKIVFPKSRSSKSKNEPAGTTGAVQIVAAQGSRAAAWWS
jgi:hypothetical protein